MLLFGTTLNKLAKEQQHQSTISQIFDLDLPAIMPKCIKRGVDPQPHGRDKRFVSTLARILFDGVNASVNHKKTISPSKRYEETAG